MITTPPLEPWAIRRRLSECGEKHRHMTRKDARRHARQVQRKTSGKMNVYRCQWCGFWHVGHVFTL